MFKGRKLTEEEAEELRLSIKGVTVGLASYRAFLSDYNLGDSGEIEVEDPDKESDRTIKRRLTSVAGERDLKLRYVPHPTDSNKFRFIVTGLPKQRGPRKKAEEAAPAPAPARRGRLKKAEQQPQA